VAAPPHIRRGLGRALGRILPVLLPAERRQIQEGPGAAQRLDAAPGSEIGAKDPLAIAQEDAEAERLACVGRETEVDISHINGQRGLIGYLNGKPFSVLSFHIRDGRIQAIYVVTNPEKLSHLPGLRVTLP
jgi:hypothetical protein